jgi:iron complex transport system substrate-binding protein
VRIVSLLPSATEIVFALGLGDELVGVSFECDFPPPAREKPIVSRSALAEGDSMSAAELDATVSDAVAAGASIYTLDTAHIRAVQPDLILAQDLCRVCAVPSGAVEEALAGLGCSADVVSLDPSSLDEVIAGIGLVGEATGTTARAEVLMADMRRRLAAVRTAVAGLSPVPVLALEWSAPPFNAGHWVPDMITAAGGVPVLAPAHEPSRRLGWEEIAAAEFSTLVFMPCGYRLPRSVAEGRLLLARSELAGAAEVWAVDGDSYFSRPGPRVVDGVEHLAAILHPEVAGPPTPAAAARLR